MRVRAALIAVLLLGASACTATTNGSAHTTSAGPVAVSGLRTLTGNERAYGPSVGAVPGAEFKPDVVVIGGGANAIRGADSSGLVWTIEGSAPGADKLAVGKIMVATAFATGRVLRLVHAGADVQVTLGPVALTDVYSRLEITSSSPVTLQQPLAYSYPGTPTSSTRGDSGTRAGPPSTTPSVPPTAPPEQHLVEPVQVGPYAAPGGPTIALPAPTVTPKPMQQGKFTLTPYCCFPSQGVRIAYNTATGRMAATVGLVMGNKPLLDFHIDIDGGGLREATFELRGPEAIEFGFEAATKDVSGNYRSPTLRLPVSLTFPLAGIPFTITLTQSVYASIQLAGQAAFSTSGQYTISGGLGFSYKNGHFGAQTPSFSTKLSALQNATSLSVGINAATLGYGARLSAGIGVLGFTAGPYFSLGASLAIAKDGSPPQTSLTAGCVTAGVYAQGSYGVGYEIPAVVADLVNTFLHLVNAAPIKASGGLNWGPYTLWNPGRSQRCLKR
jgi:hypothetical protein